MPVNSEKKSPGGDPATQGRNLSLHDDQAGGEYFVQILMNESVLNRDSLRKLAQLQQSQPPDERRAIGRLAVDEGYLDESRFLALLDNNCRRLHLGELLVLRGLLKLIDLEHAIQEQRDGGGMLGEVLLRMELLTPSELAEGLAEQSGVAYVPIANIPPHEDLARWVNPGFAARNGVVPVGRQGRNLIVAVWQPRALAIAGDLEQATGLNVQVILTTRAEVENRILALYSPTCG